MTRLEHVRRVAKVVGIVGGTIAVVWAMRDRLVSIAATREPEPPQFRVVTPPSDDPAPLAPAEGQADDLTTLPGVGPATAAKLVAAGFETLDSIAASTPEALVAAVGGSSARAASWIAAADVARV